jgi:hypothetical protein
MQELRESAANKRRLADLARVAGRFTSKARDEKMMLQLANELEAEAAELDAQATAIEEQDREDKSN